MRDLSPGDLLFVGGFVAALSFVVAGFVTVVAPPALPGFVGALVNAFLLLGAAFLLLGVGSAALVALLDA